MKRLEEFIEEHARNTPSKIAVSVGENAIDYEHFWQKIDSEAERLGKLPGRSIILRASPTIEFLVTYFAAHLSRKIFVPLESDAKDEYFASVREIVENSYIPANVNDILFTTGTTGKQKGTMLSDVAIACNADNLVDALGFEENLTFIVNGPLNHIGSLSKVWASVMAGSSIKIIDGVKDLNALFSAIHSSPYKVATFLVPASIRMMLQFGKKQLEESKAKIAFIETGAAPISQADMEELGKALPFSNLYNTYASTETGIISTHDFNNDICIAGCLGKMMKHSILNIGEDGLINCTGPTVMSGYVGDEELTARVLRDGIVYTQDKGVLDEHGRLHLLGREGDVLNIGGYKINPVEIENAARSFPGISDCICIADNHPVLGKALRLLVVMENKQVLHKRDLAAHLSAKLEKHKIPQMYSVVDEVKRTYNGKLNRKYYLTNRL